MRQEDRKTFIHFLLICSSQQYEYVLKTLTKDQLQVITEIIFNIVKGVCPISDENKILLMKRRRLIRAVLGPKLTPNLRKKGLQKIKKTPADISESVLTVWLVN